jgi:hypothetical protein
LAAEDADASPAWGFPEVTSPQMELPVNRTGDGSNPAEVGVSVIAFFHL